MNIKVITNPVLHESATRELETFCGSIHERFAAEGRLLYKGRNSVKEFPLDSSHVVVKRFKPLSFWRSLSYSIRKSKAKKAYLKGLEIIRRGFSSPSPLAYVEVYRQGMIRDMYFVSKPDSSPSLLELWKIREPARKEIDELASFIYSLHCEGILHGDLNLSNILVHHDGFSLIDNNRSVFRPCDKRLQYGERIKNIVRITHQRPLLSSVLRSYAGYANYDPDDFVRDGIKEIEHRERMKDLVHTIFGKSKH